MSSVSSGEFKQRLGGFPTGAETSTHISSAKLECPSLGTQWKAGLCECQVHTNDLQPRP